MIDPKEKEAELNKEDNEDGGGGSCTKDSDCGVGQECVDGVCKAKNTTGPIVNPPIPPQ